MPPIKIPAELLTSSEFNAYSDAGSKLKALMHSKGKTLMREIAKRMDPDFGDFTVRSNSGGIAVSGEVTLHAEHLYVMLSDSSTGQGLQMMYRSCASRKDCVGAQNNWVKLSDFSQEDRQERVLAEMNRLVHSRKSQAQPA